MRGTSMQDVIFAGSDGRRPAAAAEVELTFDNSDGALSVPTPEVSIGRRVVRGGETTYTINRAACRLTDVIELTAELGLGREMHSIIGQGKVETLLAAKPQERRALVEEAAGLGRYKRRRERSETKLREVRRNLERARDLEREAGLQLAPLRRQANAAETLRTIEHEMAETRGRLLAGDLDELDARLAEERETLADDRELAGLRSTRASPRPSRSAWPRRNRSPTTPRERERRAGRALRARYLGDRLSGCHRLIEQRGALLDELRRAADDERAGLMHELEGGAAPLAADAAADLSRLRGGAGRRRGRADRRPRPAFRPRGRRSASAAPRAAALSSSSRRSRHAARATSSAARPWPPNASAWRPRSRGPRRRARRSATSAARSTSLARRGRGAGRRRGGRRRRPPAKPRPPRRPLPRPCRRCAGSRPNGSPSPPTAITRPPRSAELREVDADVLRLADAYPGVVELSSAVSCERGYELALGAALAQHPGTLAVPDNALAVAGARGAALGRRPAGATARAAARPLARRWRASLPRSRSPTR